MNDKRSGNTPTAEETDEGQPSVHQHQSPEAPQGAPRKIRSTTVKPRDPEVTKRLAAARVPYNEAWKQARELFYDGQFEEAEVECRRAIALLPIIDDKPSYLDEPSLLGEILVEQGRNQEALECLREAEEVSYPRMIALNLALAHCRLGDLENARQLYLSELDTTPPTIYGIVDEADRKAAIDRHNVRLSALPGTDTREALEASILLERGGRRLSSNLKGALADYRAADELAPDNWRIAEAMGHALHYYLGRPDEAASYYRRAAELGGEEVSD